MTLDTNEPLQVLYYEALCSRLRVEPHLEDGTLAWNVMELVVEMYDQIDARLRFLGSE